MQTSPAGRTNRQRQTGRNQNRKKQKSVMPFLILFAAVLALMVIITPKEPLKQALNTVATVDENGNQITVLSSTYAGLRISEVMTSNNGSVPDESGSYPDWVEVWNSSEQAINLYGVGLSDREDTIKFIFPEVMLSPDARIVVFCSGTNSQSIATGLHAKFKLSSSGEHVYLFDPNAYELDAVTTPVMNTNEVYTMQPDGSFALSAQYTPGYENTEDGHNAYLKASTVTSGALVINEVMASAKTGLKDEDGEYPDWVEIHNTTDQPVSLANYALSDKETSPLMWRFPEDAYVPANGYYVVFCSGKNKTDASTGLVHTNFSISAELETIVLSDSYGRTQDRITIENIPADCTYGRNAYGTWQIFTIATPGLPNTQSGMWESDMNLRARNPIGVIITEVMASNSSITAGSSQLTCDWVELYNSSTQTVYLENYGLSDSITRGRKWQFPSGTTLEPGQYMIVYCDSNTAADTATELHANFSISREGGETIVLATPDGEILDKLTLPQVLYSDVSYGRGTNAFRYFDIPTPLSANNTGFSGYTGTPSFSKQGGIYEGTLEVTIDIPQGAQVYYTLDGSLPSKDTTLYNGETFALSTTTVIRARAYQDNLQCSPIITATYLLNVYHSLPIVCITTDPDVLWNPQTGFLVDGPDIDKTKVPFAHTIYRTYGKINQPGYVEYYKLDNTQVLSQGMEFRLYGDYSLDLPQKSMKVIAKAAQGNKVFNAQLFEDRPYTEYKTFLLRNGGNDGLWARLVDGLESRLVDMLDTTVIHMAWNPVVVYINGIYWGHYNMREAKDNAFIANHEGIPLSEKDNITVLQGNMTAVHGSNKEYKDMIAKIKTLSPGKNPEDLQYILDRVDVDNYFDWMAIEMFFGNSDIGNCRMYKVPGGKWKWLMYDLDYGLFNSKFDSPYSYTKEKGMGQVNIDNTIFRKLMENAEMKDLFLTKLGAVYQTFTTEVMLAKIDELAAILEPEMPIHFARWAEFHDKQLMSDSKTTPDAALRYWYSRVDFTRNVIKKRPNLLYPMIQEAFSLTQEQMLQYFGQRPEMPADAIL